MWRLPPAGSANNFSMSHFDSACCPHAVEARQERVEAEGEGTGGGAEAEGKYGQTEHKEHRKEEKEG